ncbi:hypothetical protein JK365_00210 [Salmonella enterica subsp. enterica serovar Ceyco]|uniref:hypothetical protein n=1 Tax=Salmonella enterica TaxID=28901 RepID=UPI0019209DCF|nr:hypothetical protein [Salmonella enterica subsp. enterica]EEP6390279.1 hypothetical protein [Salmonella enterica subsp. enterica]MBL1250937.1 hypothetical protein [Salmonella enterica subsp. enterica serovar Ceyco]
MNLHKRWLTFVLSDDGSFDELIIKTEQAFKHKLICIDDEGRYIASADLDEFSIRVIDKVDRLSELLCDEHHTLEIVINSERYFNYEFEEYIKKILHENGIQWQQSVWAPDKLAR